MSRAKAPPVKIVVDVHERQSGIAETLAELGAEIEIASLAAGDYAVGADTLVERKRVLDLHAAVLKGRFCRSSVSCARPAPSHTCSWKEPTSTGVRSTTTPSAARASP